jgi:hypothetical protein
MKGLYAFNDPLGAPDAKAGITGHFEVRLGVYQNSYSRNSHVACFDILYIGPARAIENLFFLEANGLYIFQYCPS